MEISAESIYGKICKKTGSSLRYVDTGGDGNERKCGVGSTGGSASVLQLRDFRTGVLEKEKGWPSSGDADETRDDNAKKVARDLTKLNSDEKNIVAGLLAKTIEGGEVVEIRAVSSTSVMYCQFISLYETTSHDVMVVWRFEKLLIPL
ncbi:hypothetical protein ANAPC1_01330 [Anaplasma phagocytophilum]|uniref:Uncharacterized protein n=1 Tax=Anaplasma phagocytophilum TaxID=948 RepID=A0AA45ZI75_ANAPH|nr:hypothetical protein [Anaplasma phagocytophilum]SBO14953.1 hypothetical protein ANAPC1_01330 [Anaplasma phagocytophilum]